MSVTLIKRTAESLWYDFDCSAQLNTGETIVSVTGVIADQAGLTFGTPQVNTAVITYSDGKTAAIGTVISVTISGGTIPTYLTSQLYTVRAKFTTNIGNSREAAVTLNVTDVP